MLKARDGGRGQTFFIAAVSLLAALVVVTAWLGPSGCQSNGGAVGFSRPPRPKSPLDDAVDLRRAPDAADGAALAAQPPEPPAERPLPPATEPMVRVRIAAVRGGAAELSLPRGAFVVGELGSDAPRSAGTGERLELASPISVTTDGASWTIRSGSGAAAREFRLSHARALDVRPASGSAPITFAGKSWPGELRLHARSDASGGIDVVARVGIERYLPGVLARELYRTWDLETYRAQAIAARSYAVCEAAYWANRRHFDMVAGEASQAWIGETDHANANRAVADTRGMLLVYEGRVVPAYYSSCCGGAAADAIECVTRNPNHDIPPLALGREKSGRRARCCNQAPTYAWRERVALDEIGRRLVAWGRENGRGDLAALRGTAALEVVAVNEAGRTRSILVTDTVGTKNELDAEVFRSAMNGAPADPARALSADAAPRRTLKSSDIEISIDRGTAVFDGHGHGHGAGLCQYGSEAMARAGRSWKEILVRYYPGASAARCW